MPRWTLEQELAITESGKNIIVSAGAGSGKTAVLTERVIRKLKSGISISELLILTFTNNAAHEMKERIRNSIKRESENNESLKKELDFIDNAYITTFDSYALSIVKKYHYLLNIGKDISIIDSNIVEIEKKKIIDDIFENLYKEKNEKFLKFVKLLCIKDDTELKGMIIKVNDSLDLLADKNEYIHNYMDTYYDDEFVNNELKEYEKLIVDKVKVINKLLESLATEVDGKYLDLYYNELGSLLNSKDYDSIKRNLNIKLSPLRNTTELGKTIKKNITDIIKNLNNMCYYTKDELINSVYTTRDYVSIILDIINDLDNRIHLYKNKLNMYEFNDISIMAIDIVKNNLNVREELTNTYKEICIDEYQDTSDLQETFINFISNNNVYCVGDIKQSIYRFRNANPMLFKTKYDNYSKNINGMKIDLVKNFRSRNEVLDNINEIFNLIMDNTIGGAEYSESHNMIFGNTTYINEGKVDHNNNLEIYNYEYDKKSIYKKDEIEAFIIANDIKNKIESEYKVFDKDNKILRNICYDDFVILMDRSSSFDLYKKILESLGIPTTLFKDENIIDEDEIRILKNIISLIIKIKDKCFDTEFKYYFTSIVRSYLSNYNDDDIFKCFLNNDFKNNDVFIKCSSIATNIDSMSCVELLNNIVREFDIYNNFINVGNIESRTMIINYLYETFSNLDSIGYSVYDLSNYLNDLIVNNKQIKVNMNTDNANSVKIMTIHKSKGLEYHVCYFSGFDKTFNLSDIKTRIVYDNKYGIIVPYYNEGLNDLFIKDLIKNKYLIDDISERIRLLYVALTRVKEKMIIVGSFLDEDDSLENNGVIDNFVRSNYKSFNSIMNSIKKKLVRYIKSIDLNKVKLNKDYNNIRVFNYKDNIDKCNDVIDIKNINIENSIKEDKHFSKINNSIVDVNTHNNMEFGTYMHELLESINLKDIDYSIIDDKYVEYIKNFSNLDILSNVKNANIYKEYEFVYDEDNTRYHGIIDLMLEYDDFIDIIDYKLMNTMSDDYIKQLNGYKKYIEKVFKKRVNIYLYSIINNELRSI